MQSLTAKIGLVAVGVLALGAASQLAGWGRQDTPAPAPPVSVTPAPAESDVLEFGYGERSGHTADLIDLPAKVRDVVARSVERGTPRSPGGWANRAQSLVQSEQFAEASKAFANAAREYAERGDANTAIVMRTQSERYESDLRLFYNRPASPATVKKFDTGRRLEPVYGVYTGAFIDREDGVVETFQDGNRKFRDIAEFNSKIGKKHASFFTYNGYGSAAPTGWFAHLSENGAAAQWVIEPRSLSEVQDDARLRAFAEAARDAGVPVFVRFASEMNGRWTPYHSPSALYKEKFQLVARVFHRIAPNAAMVWCPNNMPEPAIPDYYPGADAVDWVGVNFYAPYFNDNDTRRPVGWRNPSDNLRYIYDRYAAAHPILIGEWAATHRQSADDVNRSGWAQAKIAQLYAALPRRYPRVKAVHWFAMDTTRFAGSPSRRINDYSLLSDDGVARAYRAAVRPDYFLESAEIGKRAMAPEEVAPLAPKTPLKGTVTLSAWAKTYEDRPQVTYQVNGRPLATITEPGEYAVKWDTTAVPDGPATVAVQLRDSKGRVASQVTVPVVVRNGGGGGAVVTNVKPKPAPTPVKAKPTPDKVKPTPQPTPPKKTKPAPILNEVPNEPTLAEAMAGATVAPEAVSLSHTPDGALSLSDRLRFQTQIGKPGYVFLTLRRENSDEQLLFPSRKAIAGGDISAARREGGGQVAIPSDPNRALQPDEAGEYIVRAYLFADAAAARAFAQTWAGADSPDAATLSERRRKARITGTVYVSEDRLTLRGGTRNKTRGGRGVWLITSCERKISPAPLVRIMLQSRRVSYNKPW